MSVETVSLFVFQRKLLNANFLLMRWGSTFLAPFWLFLSCSTRTLVAFERSRRRLLPFCLTPEQSGVLAECFSLLLDSVLHSAMLLETSSLSFLSLSSGQGYIRRFLIFECECALAPDGRSAVITLRCKRFFFGAHKRCFAKAGLSPIGGVTCTVDIHPSISFKSCNKDSFGLVAI